MAKKNLSVRTSEGNRIPFLRGILVQSLTAAGLSFADAYALAQSVRTEHSRLDEISTDELRRHTAHQLEARFGAELRQAYEAVLTDTQGILVLTSSQKAPFSVGVLAHYLERCAITKEASVVTARRVLETLQADGRAQIEGQALQPLVYRALNTQVSARAANAYLSWRRFEKSRRPLILLIGGASGTGKSTVAAEVAYRLHIVRTQSTDIMREIIRASKGPNRYRTLDYSSFEAWRGLSPLRLLKAKKSGEARAVTGFVDQFKRVKMALEATIARAVKEGHDLIVEGVHVLPSELALGEMHTKAVIVPVMLAVSTKETLLAQFTRRGIEQPDRAASRYRSHVDDVWALQGYLLGLADRAMTPIVGNWVIEESVHEILKEVCARLGERFPGESVEGA